MKSVSPTSKTTEKFISVPSWVHVLFAFGFLVLVIGLDFYQPSFHNWSNLYFLIVAYIGFFLRGRIELVAYILTILATLLTPAISRPGIVSLERSVLNRSAGLTVGLMMIAFIRGRRKYMDALRIANDELERAVTDRTEQLNAAFISLQIESATRQQIAESLRQSKEQYFALVDQAPIGLYVNLNNKYAYVNDAVCRMMGATSKEQLLGTSVLDRFDAADVSFIPSRATEVLEYGVAAPRSEMICRRLDGSTFDVETISIPVEFENQQAIQVLINDISERKRLKAQLRNERDFLRQVLDSQFAFISVLNPDGMIIEINKLLLTVAGFSLEDVIGRKFIDMGWVTDENNVVIEAAIKACARGQVARIEVTGTFRRESPRTIDEIFSPIKNKAGEVTSIVAFGVDITKRKKAEESLQMMRFCVDHAGDNVYWVGRNGRILYVNHATCALHGFSQSEMLQMTISDLDVEPDYQPEVWEKHFEELKRRGTMTFESRHRAKDGRIFSVEINANYVQIGNKELNFSFLRDITNRKDAERSLRLSQFSINRAVDSVFWISPAGKILFVNDSAARQLGYTREELLEMFVWQVTPDFSESDWAAHWEEIKQRGSYTFESRQITKRGRLLETEVTVNYLLHEGMEYNCAVVRDITDRKHTEEDLNRVWQNAIDPLCIGGHDGYFKKINPAWVKSLGWTEDDLLSHPWLEFVHIDDRETTIRAGSKLRNDEPVTDFENRFRCKDGSYRWFSWNVIPDVKRRISYGFVRDITERKRFESEFLESQKIEAVGRLAGGVAHDFNNLLTIITGYGELLQSELPSDSPQQESVATILDASDRAARLTRQLLEFGRKVNVEPKVVDLNEIVNKSANMLRALLEGDFTIEFNCAPNLSHILATSDQIERVLMNLVVNSRDAMPDGGDLRIETRNTELREFSTSYSLVPGDYVQLTVTDTGQGMTDAVKAKIFEPFFTTKETGKGTGLGMSVVYGIVKQYGGEISVESKLNMGTKVKILLPAVHEEPAEESMTPCESTFGNETILLVEDKEDVRKIVRLGLEKDGYYVIEASDGAQALLNAEQYSGTIDLLLTDVVMPKMSGPQLAAEMRNTRTGIRVLFMSGYTDDVVLQRGITNSEETLLQKPFTSAALSRKVRSIIDDPV